MYTVDIHSHNETVIIAIDMLIRVLPFAKKEKDRILCVITGYGSSGKTHKIKTGVINYLNEEIGKGIKGYILGEELDLFHPSYLSCPFKDRIPLAAKKNPNPGAIYIYV